MLRPPRPLAEQLSFLELLVRLGGSMKFTLSGGGAISGEVQAGYAWWIGAHGSLKPEATRLRKCV